MTESKPPVQKAFIGPALAPPLSVMLRDSRYSDQYLIGRLSSQFIFTKLLRSGETNNTPNAKDTRDARRISASMLDAARYAQRIGIRNIDMDMLVVNLTERPLFVGGSSVDGDYQFNTIRIDSGMARREETAIHELAHFLHERNSVHVGLINHTYLEAGAMLFTQAVLNKPASLDKEFALLDKAGRIARKLGSRNSSHWGLQVSTIYDNLKGGGQRTSTIRVLNEIIRETENDIFNHKYILGGILAAVMLPFYNLEVDRLAKDLLRMRHEAFIQGDVSRVIAKEDYNKELAAKYFEILRY